MSAYRDALAIDTECTDHCLDSAVEVLASGAGVVLLNNTIALCQTATHLLCEVVEPTTSSRLCEYEFQVLVENAQRMLDCSRLGERLPDIPRKWRIVEDCGTGTAELWRAS